MRSRRQRLDGGAAPRPCRGRPARVPPRPRARRTACRTPGGSHRFAVLEGELGSPSARTASPAHERRPRVPRRTSLAPGHPAGRCICSTALKQGLGVGRISSRTSASVAPHVRIPGHASRIAAPRSSGICAIIDATSSQAPSEDSGHMWPRNCHSHSARRRGVRARAPRDGLRRIVVAVAWQSASARL